jgi:Ala-tRNA(Pro) deacylase
MSTGVREYILMDRRHPTCCPSTNVPAMTIVRFLDREGVPFKWLRGHSRQSPNLDPGESIAGSECVIKTVIAKCQGRFLLCAIPEDAELDLQRLARTVGAKSVALADESDLKGIFLDCERGAEPPFGNLYGLKTVMDVSVEDYDSLVCRACTHGDAIRLRLADYEKLVEPVIAPVVLQNEKPVA